MERVDRAGGRCFLRRRSGGGVVFVDESADYWALPDPVDGDGFGRWMVDGGGGALVDPTMRPVAVVVVEEFGSGGADEAFGGGVGVWRSGWGVDDVELVRGEVLVERGVEHGGVVSGQEPEPIDVEGHGEVAGGLGTRRR